MPTVGELRSSMQKAWDIGDTTACLVVLDEIVTWIEEHETQTEQNSIVEEEISSLKCAACYINNRSYGR